MKKIVVFSIALLISGITNAQVVGAKAGINISNMIKTGDQNFTTDFKTGFHAGLYLDVHLADVVSFEPQLMFSQKGYKTSGSSLLGGAYDYTQNLDFIEVPLLLKIGVTPTFSIHVGPQVSFLTSSHETYRQGSDAYKNTVREDNSNLRKNLFGGAAGIDIGGSKVGFSAGYALDFQKNNGDGTSETPEYKNQVFQLGLSIGL